MAITNAFALRYSNEYIRPLADYLGKAYHFGVELIATWNALGSSLPTLALHEGNFRRASKLVLEVYNHGFVVNEIWLAGASTFFPNTTEVVADSGDGATADPTRPAITGAKVNAIITRRAEFANWLTTGLFAGGGADAGAQRNEFTKAWFGVGLNQNAAGLTTANLLITYLTQLKTEYEASSNAKLNSVLQVAVNPGASL